MNCSGCGPTESSFIRPNIPSGGSFGSPWWLWSVINQQPTNSEDSGLIPTNFSVPNAGLLKIKRRAQLHLRPMVKTINDICDMTKLMWPIIVQASNPAPTPNSAIYISNTTRYPTRAPKRNSSRTRPHAGPSWFDCLTSICVA